SISTSPPVGSTIRLIIRSSVVLPQPEDPTSTVVRCAGSVREKSSTASVPSPNLFVTERNSITRYLRASWWGRSRGVATVGLEKTQPHLADSGVGRDGMPQTRKRHLTDDRHRRRVQQLGHVGADERRRSEEHTSELQSRENLVCRLLLEKKNKSIHSNP